MIKDLVNNFSNASLETVNVILDNYRLKEGLYIRFNNSDISSYDYMIIKKKVEILHDDVYRWFRDRDYYSSILDDDMNKAVDTKKQIHSTNEFTLFIKKNNFPGMNKDSMSIDEAKNRITSYYSSIKLMDNKYYEIYSKSDIKKTEKLSKEKFFNKYFKTDIEYLKSDSRINQIDSLGNFFSDNINAISDIIKVIDSKDTFSNYIKIFINTGIEKYKKAYKLYITPRIFNKNDFNSIISNEIKGLPSSNVTANDKKPYLLSRTMKIGVPIRVSTKEAINIKDFFLWLKSQNKDNIKISYDFKYDKEPGKDINGSFYDLYVNRGSMQIEDYDNIPFVPQKINLEIKNYLYRKGEDNLTLLPDESIINRGDLLYRINNAFFAGKIKGYFKKGFDKKDMPLENNVFTAGMQSLFIICKEALYDFVVLGVEKPFSSMADKITMQSIKEQLLYTVNGTNKAQFGKLSDAYNLRLALINYFKTGGCNMGDQIKNVYEKLKTKLLSKEIVTCESDEEFYFTAGQVAFYIMSQSEAKNKNYGLFEPFVHAKGAQDIKNKIKDEFEIYKYAIRFGNLKFENAMGMIMGYDCESKFSGKMQDMFYAGIFVNNIFYEKKEEDNKPKEVKSK